MKRNIKRLKWFFVSHCKRILKIAIEILKIMSNVTIKAEVVETAQLFVCLDFSHHHIRVFLFCPLFAQKLIQVDCL